MAEIPDSVMKRAGAVVADIFPNALLSMDEVDKYALPIATALLAERAAQIERDAGIADECVRNHDAARRQFGSDDLDILNEKTVTAKVIAKAIRGQKQ